MLGGQPGERHLEQQPHLGQLGDRCRLGREHPGDRVADRLREAAVGAARDETPAAGAARGAQADWRARAAAPLADRRTADVQLPREVRLGAQAVARPERPRGDRLLEQLRHVVA